MANGFVNWEKLLAVESFTERLSLDVRHYVVEKAVGLAGLVQREDVWMVEPRGDLDLAQEAIGAERRGELGMKHLQRDKPLVPAVLSEVDGRHSTAPELTVDGVRLRQRGAEALEG